MLLYTHVLFYVIYVVKECLVTRGCNTLQHGLISNSMFVYLIAGALLLSIMHFIEDMSYSKTEIYKLVPG